HFRLHVFDTDIFGVNLPQRRMVLDGFVKERLSNRGVIYFAVPVATIADQIDDNVGAKAIAILDSKSPDAHHGIDIFRIHMEDWDRLPTRDLRRESRGISFLRHRGEANKVVGDDVNRSADGVTSEIGKVQRLSNYALASKSRISVNQQWQIL